MTQFVSFPRCCSPFCYPSSATPLLLPIFCYSSSATLFCCPCSVAPVLLPLFFYFCTVSDFLLPLFCYFSSVTSLLLPLCCRSMDAHRSLGYPHEQDKSDGTGKKPEERVTDSGIDIAHVESEDVRDVARNRNRNRNQALVGDKEIMHVLESTLITWTKQIKNILKQVSGRSTVDQTHTRIGPTL